MIIVLVRLAQLASHEFVELETALGNVRFVGMSFLLMGRTFIVSFARAIWIFATILHHNISKFSGIYIGIRV